APGDVVRKSLDMELYRGPVGRKQGHGHTPFLPDHDGMGAIRGQRDLDQALFSRIRVVSHDQQPARRLARFHAPSPFPSTGVKPPWKLTAEAQIAIHLAEPTSKLMGIRDC